jgi:hypothetical protein
MAESEERIAKLLEKLKSNGSVYRDITDYSLMS